MGLKKRAAIAFVAVSFIGYTHIVSAIIMHERLFHSHFFMTVEGDLIKQMSDGTIYTLLDPRPARTINNKLTDDISKPPQGTVQRVNSAYVLSGGISFGYQFDNLTDLIFSLFLNSHGKHSSVAVDPQQAHLDPILAPVTWINADSASKASSLFRYKTNIYNLLIGHWFYPTQSFYIHPYFGLNISDINLKQETNYNAFITFNNNQTSIDVFEKSSTTAYGPITGINLLLKLNRSIALEGNIALGMLTGRISSTYEPTSLSGAPFFTDGIIRSKTGLSIIQLIQMQAGLGYQTAITNTASLYIAAGYRLIKYLGTAATHSAADRDQPGISLHFFEDAGFLGPFLSITMNIF